MIFYPPMLQRGICICPRLVLIPRWAQHHHWYHMHEFTHVEQQEKIGAITFWWRYLTDKGFRLRVEVEAYQAEVAAGGSGYAAAKNLSEGYGLNITFEQAQELLS